MKRIAYLGPEGTVSEESARHFFREEDGLLIPFKQISDVFQATVREETDYSVIPIENTIEGSVSIHLDWLIHKVNLPIQAEWVYPSVQHLIAHPEDASEGALSGIRRVISHPVAIAQCREFLDSQLPGIECEHVSSTAEGVRIVADNPGKGWAAIGTRLAAQKFGLRLLRENIMDHANNYTRFLLIGRSPVVSQTDVPRKTSIVVTLPEDYPGALHQVLSAFAWRRLNLSRIESRPTKQKLGNYYFVIDIEAGMDTVLLPAAISEIEAIGCQVRILGSYPSFSYESGGAC